MCTCDDLEQPAFFAESTRTARRHHTCCECDHPIVPGERHHYVSGKWDGNWSIYRTCSRCAAARDLFAHFECAGLGELACAADEMIGELGEDERAVAAEQPAAWGWLVGLVMGRRAA